MISDTWTGYSVMSYLRWAKVSDIRCFTEDMFGLRSHCISTYIHVRNQR